MGHFLLSAEAGFSAAHTLPGIEMCDRFHGHNWKVRVTVRVEETALDEAGMGVDFRAIQSLAQDTVADFEHRYLNDLAPFEESPPSAERLVKVIAQRVDAKLHEQHPNARLAEIVLWEMPEYRVVYRP